MDIKLPYITTEQKNRLRKYRDNLILSLMELRGYALIEDDKSKPSLMNAPVLNEKTERHTRNILTEIYTVTLLIDSLQHSHEEVRGESAGNCTLDEAERELPDKTANND